MSEYNDAVIEAARLMIEEMEKSTFAPSGAWLNLNGEWRYVESRGLKGKQVDSFIVDEWTS